MNILRSSTLCIAMAAGASLAVAHGDETHAASAAGAHAHGHGAAIGLPGKAEQVSRTVQVEMIDAMRFNPASIEVKQGETIRFVVKNSGQLKHEFVLGTDAELKEHYELMKKFPEMEHSDPNQASVAAGKTGEVIWQFTRPGKVAFACLQPGHYDAGMKGIIRVAAGKGPATKTGAPVGEDHLAPAASSASPSDTTPVADAAAMTDGEVRKVDKENQKVTLKHGVIKNLDMPPMTMVFKVKDPAMLEAVKPGDKVRFKAERIGGALVVTDMQHAD